MEAESVQPVPSHFSRQTGRLEDSLFEAAESFSDSVAIAAAGDECSYRELADRASRFAAALVDAGLKEQDRVGIYLDKTPDSVVALYATWIAGGIAVPVNEGLRGPQLGHILDDAGCHLLVSDRRKLRSIDPKHLGTAKAVEVSCTGEPIESADHAGGDAPAALLYTSGSSGKPKGILISHANLVVGAEIVSDYLGLTSADRILSALPFSFDYGLNQLLSAVHRGARCVLQRSMFPADLCRCLQEHEITVLAGVPPLWIQLMQDVSPFAEMDFPSLRILTNSGGVFPVDLVARYRAKLPEARIFLMYGLSEAFRSSYLPPEEIHVRPDSMGKAIPRCELFVLDEEGRECAPGKVGELVHRGPTVALGYWNAPEATAQVFRPDPIDPSREERVVFSGDLVRRDEEGFLYFVSRRDQMIKSMGYRISPQDVEEQLRSSGLVSEVVVGGRPDDVAGQAVVAHVVPVDPDTYDPDELLRFCRREMPSYMIPAEINLHGALPRTSSGKFDRKRLLG
jgi:amino acid adenylation domain-containing protein